jgi:hypothetical protein
MGGVGMVPWWTLILAAMFGGSVGLLGAALCKAAGKESGNENN